MTKKIYHWYILSARGGQEEKIIEKIKLELEKSEWKDYVRDLKIFSDKNKKKILKGYIFCHCSLTPGLARFFYNIPGIIGFLNHQRKDEKLPDFVSPEVVKGFSIKVQEEKKNSVISQVSSLNIGDLVKITDGTFVNYEGRVSHLNEKKREVKIDIEFAGRITSIAIPIKDCQKVLV